VPFPVVAGQLVLVDFDNSILDYSTFMDRAGDSPTQSPQGAFLNFVTRCYRFIAHPTNQVTQRLTTQLLSRLRSPQNQSGRPRLLVVGGGLIGSGVEHLYEAADIDVISMDIYASPHTHLIADGHNLPFAHESFDAVLIQAVLEHVLSPHVVVDEIHRVLRNGGLVYADSSFMQQVHAGPYDFMRFTVSGHRWLFRRFELIEAGASLGAGTGLLWAIRYFVAAYTGSWRFGQAASLPFLWLRKFDGASRRQQDAASGVYFFGAKSATAVKAQDMVSFYEMQAHRRKVEDRRQSCEVA
jgi:SAM-dependent methyltransferase